MLPPLQLMTRTTTQNGLVALILEVTVHVHVRDASRTPSVYGTKFEVRSFRSQR